MIEENHKKLRSGYNGIENDKFVRNVRLVTAEIIEIIR
jgi:hypothetical protein